MVNVHFESFRSVLEFIYTGVITDKKNLETLISLSKTFELDYLTNFVENIQRGDEDLNPSIGTFLSDETGKKMLDIYFNKDTISDVTFEADGKNILGHRTIVGTRCEVLRRMVSNSNFREGKTGIVRFTDTTFPAVKAFLEFIYSDHAPIQDSGDSVGVMKLAHEYELQRLISLCELYISKEVEVATTDGIENAQIDIIGLLELAQAHNANQLAAFCLHFISSNYEPMKKRREWDTLSRRNRQYIEEHRWPPLNYLNQLEEYEKATGKTIGGGGENCMVM